MNTNATISCVAAVDRLVEVNNASGFASKLSEAQRAVLIDLFGINEVDESISYCKEFRTYQK